MPFCMLVKYSRNYMVYDMIRNYFRSENRDTAFLLKTEAWSSISGENKHLSHFLSLEKANSCSKRLKRRQGSKRMAEALEISFSFLFRFLSLKETRKNKALFCVSCDVLSSIPVPIRGERRFQFQFQFAYSEHNHYLFIQVDPAERLCTAPLQEQHGRREHQQRALAPSESQVQHQGREATAGARVPAKG